MLLKTITFESIKPGQFITDLDQERFFLVLGKNEFLWFDKQKKFQLILLELPKKQKLELNELIIDDCEGHPNTEPRMLLL
jgi:hypothetical protein